MCYCNRNDRRKLHPGDAINSNARKTSRINRSSTSFLSIVWKIKPIVAFGVSTRILSVPTSSRTSTLAMATTSRTRSFWSTLRRETYIRLSSCSTATNAFYERATTRTCRITEQNVAKGPSCLEESRRWFATQPLKNFWRSITSSWSGCKRIGERDDEG